MTSEVLEKNQTPQNGAAQTGIVDGDIHPDLASPQALHPYLAQQWRDLIDTFGIMQRHGFQGSTAYPKSGSGRADARPESGPPCSDLSLLQKQILDPYDVKLGLLLPLLWGVVSPNIEFAKAYATATNDWQLDTFCHPDPRLKASIMLPIEDPLAAAAEIERRADDRNFAQILLMSRSTASYASQRFWPIFDAANNAGIPISIHAGFGSSHIPITSSGMPSFYIEEMVNYSAAYQGFLTAMIVEGVFDRFPRLRVVCVEGGFAWVPALGARLDKHWSRLRAEVPHVKRLPSEYIRDHVWFTSQPMEEPHDPAMLPHIMETVGWDRIMFSTDYPHWDQDDPGFVLPFRTTDEQRRAYFRENGLAFWSRK